MMRRGLFFVLAFFTFASCSHLFGKSEPELCSEKIQAVIAPRWSQALATHREFQHESLVAKFDLRVVWLSERKQTVFALERWREHSRNEAYDFFVEDFFKDFQVRQEVFEPDQDCQDVFGWTLVSRSPKKN